ncbi:MAG: VOC family protein [Pseudomonadota bacterium]
MSRTRYIDHFLVIGRNLDETCELIHEKTGVAPVFGGQHSSGLSHNAIAGLGEDCYLEILTPLPGIESGAPWIERCLQDESPSLYTFCMRSPLPLQELADRARDQGYPCRGPNPWSRAQASGGLLEWDMLVPEASAEQPLVPFFIDWRDTPHPSTTAPQGLSLESFTVEAVDPEGLNRAYDAFAIEGIDVQPSKVDALHITMATPRGEVTLP